MSNTELAGRVLIQRDLRHRKIPRLMHDALVVMVQSRLQTGTLPYLTDWMRFDIDQRARPADVDVDVDVDVDNYADVDANADAQRN